MAFFQNRSLWTLTCLGQSPVPGGQNGRQEGGGGRPCLERLFRQRGLCPVYAQEQWARLLDRADEIRAFIREHDAELKAKEPR